MTDGPANTQITVNGGAFLPNEQMTLYWDQPSHVAGGANADGSGNFVTHVKPFSGDQPGVHKLCASVPPQPCANFTLEAPTPTPSPSPSPSESPSPSPTPEASAARTSDSTPAAATINGLDIITKPPFVFLPLIGIFAILVSLVYWVLSVVRRPRPVVIPSAAVVHRAVRPDYSANFGTPPPPPAAPLPEASAWVEPPPIAPPAPPPAPAPAPEPEPPTSEWEAEASPTEWGTGVPDEGFGFAPPAQEPELPDHGDLPEPGD